MIQTGPRTAPTTVRTHTTTTDKVIKIASRITPSACQHRGAGTTGGLSSRSPIRPTASTPPARDREDHERHPNPTHLYARLPVRTYVGVGVRRQLPQNSSHMNKLPPATPSVQARGVAT